MVSAAEIKDELFSIAIPGKREVLSNFFKTGPGEYGEGDIFIGVTVPQQRELVRRYQLMPPSDIANLLNEEFHECRMTALLFLVRHYQKSKSEDEKTKIFNFYLNHTKGINNWDLVDLSAPYIVGDFLLNRNRELLYELIKSPNMWEQRIAIVATLTFIRNNDFSDTFKFAEMMLETPHDLLRKAMGWMLREVGKRDFQQLYDFLKGNYKKMSRTTLRYAIEKFDEHTRKQFLKGEIN